MTIAALPTFSPEVPYAKGGCLVCAANYSNRGQAEAGINGVDLGSGDEFLGAFALCFDCAAQVALVVGFVDRPAVLDLLEEARQLSANAEEMEAAAAQEASQARLDRDTIERLVGPYQPIDSAEAV